MCTILIAWQLFDDAPVVLAANRDELLARPSDPPLRLRDAPPLWGGRDRLAGGTWLAVDPTGRLSAVTNRHPGGRLLIRDPARRSRGGLPIEVLEGPDDDSARRALDLLLPEAFNPVNVVYLSGSMAAWVGMDDVSGRQASDLSPGVHAITEQDPDDADSLKTTRLLTAARSAAENSADADELLERWRRLLSSHDRYGDGPETAACIHETLFGTVSSATVVVSDAGVRFEHAEGPPCVTPFTTVLG